MPPIRSMLIVISWVQVYVSLDQAGMQYQGCLLWQIWLARGEHDLSVESIGLIMLGALWLFRVDCPTTQV